MAFVISDRELKIDIETLTEVSSTMRELAERSLIGTHLYSQCVKPDTSRTSA